MKRIAARIGLLAGIAALYTASAVAGPYAIGTLSWDVTFPGNAGQFDIVNLTGSNDLAPDFPVLTNVSLSSLSLLVNFNNATSHTYGSGYFTLNIDGKSWDGSGIAIGGTNPLPTSATLTGTFSPLSISLDPSGGPFTISAAFSTLLSPCSDCTSLANEDTAIIYAYDAPVSGTPEPATWMLLIAGIGLIAARKLNWKGSVAMKCVLPVLCLLAVAQASFGQVKLAAATSPGTGVAGVTNASATGSGFPGGTITPGNIVVNFYTSCSAAPSVLPAPSATTTGTAIKTVAGSTKRVNFNIPLGLATGTYFVTVSDSTAPDPSFTSNCGSQISVTGSSAILNACVAGSSMGVLLPAGGAAGAVTAYTPKGYWSGSTTGVFAKDIEGPNVANPSVSIPTASVVNSCSSNPATGKTVCVANNTDVYIITGTSAAAPLTSSSNTTASFSGGSCRNCGVALNASDNTAVINMGLTPSTSNSGLQILDLNTNTFRTPLALTNVVSENISVDPTRSLVLSASEGGNFTLAQIQPDGSLKEFDSTFSVAAGGEPDSTAEDCSTGIGITVSEFTNNLTLVNLNAITFGATTYTAPNAVATLVGTSYSAGLSGVAVAQGSGHLAVVTGEFGGTTFSVVQLPATASAGVPAVVDYANSAIPAGAATTAACGGSFSAGFDPHTITAYTSPNTGDSIAVFAGYSGSVPKCLAVVDMTTILAAPRSAGTHNVSSLPAGAITFFGL